MFLILCCSLNQHGNSRHMASEALPHFWSAGEDVELLEMADFNLPYCDGKSDYTGTKVEELREKIREAEGVLFAVPVYNYSANAVAKACVELGGDAWKDKVVGFMAAAGGQSSYMSMMGLANCLMLDFRCLILPRFVYAIGETFRGKEVVDAEVQQRIKDLVAEVIAIGRFQSQRASEG